MNHEGNSNNPGAVPDDPIDAAAWVWRRIFSYVFDPGNSAGITAAATLLICATGITYTIFAGLQWSATKETAAISEDALLKGNRPWVGQASDPVFLDNPVVGRNSVTSKGVLFSIKNFGTSPALHVSVVVIPDILAPPSSPEGFLEQSDRDLKAACSMAEMSTMDTETFAFANGRQAQIKMPAGGETIFPGNSILQQRPIHLGIGQGTTENQSMDFFGCITYRDQFDRTVHHTQFCYMTAGSVSDVKAGDRVQPCGINQNAD